MKIVFLGTVTAPDKLTGHVASVAGNKMQYHLLHYLSELPDVSLSVISFRPHSAFPKEKILWTKKEEGTLFGKLPILQVSYLNLPILKQFFLTWQFYRYAKKLADPDTILFAYDLYPIQGCPLRYLKKKVKGKTVSLLADLSIGGIGQAKHGLRKLTQSIYDKITLKNIAACDSLIVLNEYVAKLFAPHSRYMVMDGGVEPSEFPTDGEVWQDGKKTLLYSGALVEYSGIMNLIAAVRLLDNPDIELHIYGDGLLRSEVEKAAKKSPAIRYFGSVSNPEILKIQRKSWLLVNPRPVETDIAKVTFPSKIFEYLMSGRPVLSTRLNGFTEVYDKFVFFAENASPEVLAAKIQEIAMSDNAELTARAERAKAFLLANKTWEQNSNKVLSFLSKL